MLSARVDKDIRGGIKNLSLDEDYQGSVFGNTFSFWFRPQPVREAIRVAYGDNSVLGMSHTYKTYENTGNASFNFELYANRIMMIGDKAVLDVAGGGTQADISRYIEQGRRFLEALAYPPERPGNLPGIGDAPPACLLSLPGIVMIRCRVMSVEITFENVDSRGNIKELRAQLSIEEAPLSRITMQDVLERGMFRDWSGR
jgi:hypothetical protein